VKALYFYGREQLLSERWVWLRRTWKNDKRPEGIRPLQSVRIETPCLGVSRAGAKRTLTNGRRLRKFKGNLLCYQERRQHRKGGNRRAPARPEYGFP
jgi:hypothetical protein